MPSLLNHLRILIADDHAVTRAGLRNLLSSRPGWHVCAEAATGREAVALTEQYRPNIVVMDIVMPELSGLEATRRIRRLFPWTEIVVLSLHYSDDLVREIVNAGASAYVLKSDASKDLLRAIRAVSNHQPYFTSPATEVLTKGVCDQNPEAPSSISIYQTLTGREREIVQLLAEGQSCKEISVWLGISVKTAETHRTNVMRKLKMHSVSELVRFAVKHHMIEP
jgi:DNA-binding NarL/FixJ family response regulator